MAVIQIPTPLRPYVDQQETVTIQGKDTVEDVFNQLVENYPSLKPYLYDDEGALRRFVNIYLGDEDIRYLEKEKTAITDESIISIVPAIAGGYQ